MLKENFFKTFISTLETIRRPDMLLKLRSSSYKASNASRNGYMGDASSNNMYSPIKSLASDNENETNPYLTTTASVSTTSYDLWIDSYQTHSNRLFNEDCMLKSVTNSESSDRLVPSLFKESSEIKTSNPNGKYDCFSNQN